MPNRPEFNTLSQHQYGGTLGGPLVPNRARIFLNYEGQRRKESNRFSQVILDNFDALNAVRARFRLKPETLNQVHTNDHNQFLVKRDFRLGEQHTASIRYNYLNSEALNFPGGGGRASPASTAARNNETRDQAAVVNLMSVFTPRLINEARVQWARRSYDFQATINEPALEISNLILMGKTTSDMDSYRESRLQTTDNLLLVRGGHQIKVGANINFLNDEAQWNLFFPARIIFPTLQAFYDFTPAVFWWPSLKDAADHPGFSTSWSAAVPSAWDSQTRLTMNHSIFGVFAQDQWKVSSKLSLNYGVRYDVESYPQPYIAKRDLSNVQPRVGIAYAYSPKGAVRVGYGIFTDRLASSLGQVFWATEWLARGDLAGNGVGACGVRQLPVPESGVRAVDRSKRQRLPDGRAPYGQTDYFGPPFPGARRLLRHFEQGLVHVPRWHVRVGKAIRGIRRVPRLLHVLAHPLERRFSGEPRRLLRGA